MLSEMEPQVWVPMGMTLGGSRDGCHCLDYVCLQGGAAGEHVLVALSAYDGGQIPSNEVKTHPLQLLQQMTHEGASMSMHTANQGHCQEFDGRAILGWQLSRLWSRMLVLQPLRGLRFMSSKMDKTERVRILGG